MSISKKILLGLFALVIAGCKPQEVNTSEYDSSVTAFQKNVIKGDLGLCPGELSLTIDDGPYWFTYDMAKFLAKEGVPSTFFFKIPLFFRREKYFVEFSDPFALISIPLPRFYGQL